jgi:hypothetical protein
MAQDIGLLLRGLGASFSQQVPQFRQEMAQEQELARQQQLLAEQQSQRQRQAQIQDVELQQKFRAAGYQDAFALGNLLKGNNIEAGLGLLEDRLNTIEQLGINLSGDPTMMIYEDLKRAATGDAEALRRAQMRTALAVAEGIDRGELQLPETKLPEIIPQSSMVEGQVVTRDAQGNIVATRPRGLQVAPKTDESMETERSEARGVIRNTVGDINKQLGTIASSYNRIVSLLPEMESGNRAAINAGLMNVARLVSPEAVNESDVRRYSGAENEIAVLFNFLQGNGVDMNQLLQIADPLNPKTFDPQTLMGVARSVTSSSIPSLMDRLEDQKNIATQYGLSPQFVSSFLPEDSQLMKSIRNLQQSIGGQGGSQQPGRVTFRSVSEAEAAVNINALPIGTKVDIVDASGRVVDSFTVEE